MEAVSILRDKGHLRGGVFLPPSIGNGGSTDAIDSDHRGLCGLHVDVFLVARDKEKDGEKHREARDGKSNSPRVLILDVDNDGACDERPDIDGQVKVVEEAFLLANIPWVGEIELVVG